MVSSHLAWIFAQHVLSVCLGGSWPLPEFQQRHEKAFHTAPRRATIEPEQASCPSATAFGLKSDA